MSPYDSTQKAYFPCSGKNFEDRGPKSHKQKVNNEKWGFESQTLMLPENN